MGEWTWDAVRGDPLGVWLDLCDLFLEFIAEHPRTQHSCLAKMNRRKCIL